MGGGCVSTTHRVFLSDGRSVFVKSHRGEPKGLLEAEATGLIALGDATPATEIPRVPGVLAVEADRLVLEDLGVGVPTSAAWEALGRALATLHRNTAPAFGFDEDNFIGSTPQANPWTPSGPTFFAEQRLLPLARACCDRRGLSMATTLAIEQIAERLPELLPDEAPALIHGDLWTGNVHPAKAGALALVDPAAHFGYREADLAMTRLFGSLPDAFYGSYAATWPPAPGARERSSLFNLYPLLNHLLLFGKSYLGSVEVTVRRFE